MKPLIITNVARDARIKFNKETDLLPASLSLV